MIKCKKTWFLQISLSVKENDGYAVLLINVYFRIYFIKRVLRTKRSFLSLANFSLQIDICNYISISHQCYHSKIGTVCLVIVPPTITTFIITIITFILNGINLFLCAGKLNNTKNIGNNPIFPSRRQVFYWDSLHSYYIGI